MNGPSQRLWSLLRLALVAAAPVVLVFLRHRRLDDHPTPTGTLSGLEVQTTRLTKVERVDSQGLSVAGFEQAMANCPERVLSLAIIDRLRLKRPWRSSLPLTSTPLFLNMLAALLISTFHRRVPTIVVSTNPSTFLWLSGYCILNYLLFVFPYYAWNKGVSQRTTIASFPATDHNRGVIMAWLERRLNLNVQVALSLLAGIAGGVAVIVARTAFAGTVDICIASVLTRYSSRRFLGMNSVYWLWAAPLGIRQVTLCEGLELRWYSPASTPAVQQLSRLLAIAAGLAFIGVVVLFTPALYLFTRVGNRQVLTFLNALLLVIGISTVVIVGILPQVSLWRIIQQGNGGPWTAWRTRSAALSHRQPVPRSPGS